MKIAVTLAIILTLVLFALSFKILKEFSFNTNSLARIGLMSAITIVLYMVKLVPFPQGGGFSFLSVLPIMILSTVFSIEEGLLCAIIVGTLKAVIQPPFFPLQLPLDYFGGMMAIAFTPIFGSSNRLKLVSGALVAGLLSIAFSILSGGIFFGQFAPEEMNPWMYSIGYNFLGYGVEVFLSIAILTIIPISNLKQILKN